MKNPCFKCQDRHQGCHAECDRYKEWNADRERIRAQQRKEAETTDFILKSKPPRRIK